MRLLPLVLGVAIVVASRAAGVQAGDEPPKVHRSFAEALAEARAQRRALVVYVGGQDHDPARLVPRKLPPDPVVAAVSGRVGDPIADALRVRYHLLHDRPAGLVLAPDGALAAEFDPRAEAHIEQAALAGAVDAVNRYAVQRHALERRKDADALVELLNFHLDHRDLESVLVLCRKAIGEDRASLEVFGAYASALGASGNRRAEGEVLTQMLAKWPDHPEAVEWRIARATVELPPMLTSMACHGESSGDPVRARGAEALEKLLAERRAPGREAEEARIRYEIVDCFYRNVAEAMGHADWIVAHDADTWYGRKARAYLAGTLDWLGESEAARKHFEVLASALTDAKEAEQAQERARALREAPEGPRRPLTLSASLEPTAPVVGATVRLVVMVGNAGEDALENVTVSYDGHGAFERRTQRTMRVSLPAGEEQEIHFELVVQAPGELHFVVRAEDPSAGTRGKWVKALVLK